MKGYCDVCHAYDTLESRPIGGYGFDLCGACLNAYESAYGIDEGYHD